MVAGKPVTLKEPAAAEALTLIPDWVAVSAVSVTEIDWAALLPQVVVYLHTYAGQHTQPGPDPHPGGIARVEGCGPMSVAWVRDHLSAQVRKHHAGKGAGADAGKFDDAEPCKRAGGLKRGLRG